MSEEKGNGTFFVARCPEHGWRNWVSERPVSPGVTFCDIDHVPVKASPLEWVEVVSVADLLSDASIERVARVIPELFEEAGMCGIDQRTVARDAVLEALGRGRDVS